MMDFLACLGSMGLQAVLIICAVLFIRKIFFAAHVSKKYVLLLWVIPFFFLVFFVEAGGQGGEDAKTGEKTILGNIQEPEELTLEMVRDAFENQTIDEIDFHDYANGEEEHFEDGSLNYYINFYYEYEGEEYRLGASHSEGTDALENIDITRASDSEMGWLYTAEDGKERYMDDLETFFATKNKVEDWLTLELPQGYSLGLYQAGLGVGGGALISPKAYEIEGDGEAWVPAEWQYSGFVGRIPNAGERFFFHNGKLDDEYYSMMNHSSGKTIAVLDDLDCPVIFARYEHDLYTAADMAELEEQGIEPDEATSSYWYFYFVREGEEEAYYLILSTKEFSKEEALAVAGTVKIREQNETAAVPNFR